MSQVHLPLGPLVIDIAGTTLSEDDKAILTHPAVGGVILFSRNYQTRTALAALCQAIRASRDTPLLIMVDQEGGRVQRFKDEFTRLPSLSTFGRYFDHSPDEALTLTKQAGWLMATELLSVGIDLSLAPVLDLNKGMSTVIGDRAFHRNPKIVSQLARAYMQGMNEAGMAGCPKHFPGHGAVVADSHHALPIDERDLATVMADDLLPFTDCIAAAVPAIMAAHITYPYVDNVPVSFSAIWLKKILYEQLGFQGAIISDDLTMQGAAVSMDFGERAKTALAAGCDFILICNQREAVLQALKVLDTPPEVPAVKWQPLQGQTHADPHIYQTLPRWQEALRVLNTMTQQQELVP